MDVLSTSQAYFVNLYHQKYAGKNFIEISREDAEKALLWITSSDKNTVVQIPLANSLIHADLSFRRHEQLIKKYGGFIKFLDSGVLLIKGTNFLLYSQVSEKGKALEKFNSTSVSGYPFEFVDDKLKVSILVSNPKETGEKEIQTLCKVTMGMDMRLQIDNWNDYLAREHFKSTLEVHRIVPVLTLAATESFIDTAFKGLRYSDPQEWSRAVEREYFNVIINTQVLHVLNVHAYLVLHEKHILITEIEQKRDLKASSKAENKHSKRNPLYRYVVKIPENYKPRHFDLNYITAEWVRPGHTRTMWVRVENAEALANKHHGDVIKDSRIGNKIKIRIPVDMQKPKRNPELLKKEGSVKTTTYST